MTEAEHHLLENLPADQLSEARQQFTSAEIARCLQDLKELTSSDGLELNEFISDLEQMVNDAGR